jgi:hypothetical protein
MSRHDYKEQEDEAIGVVVYELQEEESMPVWLEMIQEHPLHE